MSDNWLESYNGDVDVIIAIDSDKNISYFSTAAVELFGYDQDEVMGNNITMLLPRYVRKKHDAQVDEFDKSDDNRRAMGDRAAVSGLTKDGEILILDVSIEKNDDDPKYKFFALCRDLAAR